MSLILKGIDLPKEDEVMVITVWGDDKDGTAFISNKEPMIVVPINAIQIPKGHGRLVDIDELSHRMYHEAFETLTLLQKWDGGCWIRYKMFENCRDSTTTILKGENE